MPRMESSGHVQYESVPGDDEEGGVEVIVTTDTSGAPHKAGEGKLYVMRNSGDPDGPKLYFTEAEWDAFVLGVKDGEFDLDADGNLPPLPGTPGQALRPGPRWPDACLTLRLAATMIRPGRRDCLLPGPRRQAA